VVKTVAVQGTGVAELLDEIARHQDYLASSGKLEFLRQRRLREEVTGIVLARIKDMLTQRLQGEPFFQALLGDVVSRKQDPYTAARLIMEKMEGWLSTS